MQEESGRRALFTKSQSSITPSDVANQVVRTGNAEINQIERETKQAIKDVETIVNSTLGLYKTGQNISTELNRRSLQSAQTELTKNTIEYENEVMSGGLIDRQNISFEEKLAKKQEAYTALQLSINQNKEVLEGRKGLFQKILGTEDSYNASLAEFDTKSQKALNLADRNLTNEARQAEIEFSIQNTTDIIKSINNANSTSQIDFIAGTSLENINALENSDYITRGQAQKLRSNLSKTVNDRKVQADINNAEDLILKGYGDEALKFLEFKYKAIREDRAYNESYSGKDATTQSSKIENETKLRNAISRLENLNNQNTVNKLPLDLTTSDNEFSLQVRNSALWKKYEREGNEEGLNQMANEEARLLKKRNEDPAGFLLEKNPNLSPSDIQSIYNDNGIKNRPALSKPLIKGLQNTFDMVGTNEEMPPYQQFVNAIKVSKEIMKGDNASLIKQAKLVLDPIQALAIEMELTDNPNRVQFLDFMIQKNKTGKRLSLYSTSQEREKRATFINNNAYGSYLYATNPNLAEKLADASVDMEIYSGNDKRGGVLRAKDASKIFQPNNAYIISSDRTLIAQIDKTKYDPDRVEKQIRFVQRNIPQFFNLEEMGELTPKEKMRLRGGSYTNNVTAITNDNNEVEFYSTDRQAGREKIPIGKMSLNSLPRLQRNVDIGLTKNDIRKGTQPIN